VRVKHQLKNSLLSTQRRFQWSQYTQVSTSNLPTGQAFAPALTHGLSIHAHPTGGVTC
jgi:hypothetical protein